MSSIAIRPSSALCVAALLFVASTADVSAQTKVVDNIGSEFFVGFMPNYAAENNPKETTTELLLTGEVATEVTIHYPAIDPVIDSTVAINPGEITLVDLGADPSFRWTPGAIDSNTVRIFSAGDEFVVYASNRQVWTTDIAVGLPVDALGTGYIVVSHKQYDTLYEAYSAFAVVAAHDGTNVAITPTADLQGGHPSGVPINLTLDRGEGFLGISVRDSLTNEGDLTGTLVEADRPVQVSNGHTCAAVTHPSASCDHLFEIAIPVVSWGHTAIAAPVPDRPDGSHYRILASADNTTVEQNGVVVAALNAAEYFDLFSPGSQVFSADKPILVTQYIPAIFNSSGDPNMITLLSTDQYHQDYTFATVGDKQFTDDYVSIIASDDDVANQTILLDGSPVDATAFTSIPGTNHSWALLSVEDGTHTTSSAGFHGVVAMGYDPFDTYQYNGGTIYSLPTNTGIATTPTTIASSYTLGPNYPNPFGSATTITFTLNASSPVSAAVYDLLGREVRVLLDANLTPGQHEVTWDGRDAAGRRLPGGVYLYRLNVGGLASTRSMILVD